MSDENEWQPVRIAPISNVQFCDWKEADERWVRHQGEIVRVRPLGPDSQSPMCKGRWFEVKPEDCSRIEGRPGQRVRMCEHQILAD